MSADGFTTGHVCIAAFLSYCFGEESLVRIDFDDKQMATFQFNIPSLDATEYANEYFAGTLGISDLQMFWEHQTSISRRLRVMRRNSQTTWEREEFTVGKANSSRPESFWVAAREATVQRRAERDARERQAQRQTRHTRR